MIRSGYSWCPTCRDAADREAWRNAPRVDPGEAMIFADALGRWFPNLEDYIDHCEGEGIAPESGLPWVGEFHQATAPNISEAIGDQMYEDWESEPWLDALQELIEAKFAEHKPGAWWQGKNVPILDGAR